VLQPTPQFIKALKDMDSMPELQQSLTMDGIKAPVEVLAARAIALMRVLADFFIDRNHEHKPDRLRAELDHLWPRRELVTSASFTSLRSYTNGNAAPFFDPEEFMRNVVLVKNTLGKHLRHFPWGQHSHHH
jgi:hypothetical protein